jgi:hypothetical protein
VKFTPLLTTGKTARRHGTLKIAAMVVETVADGMMGARLYRVQFGRGIQ